MAETRLVPSARLPSKDSMLSQVSDDTPTVCAITVVAAIVADVLHEAVGHAGTALLTGADSGVLSTVAWSSTQESRLVAAAGTLVNLAAGGVFWLVLRGAARAPVRWRFFLLLNVAFNLFVGTGYFLFSGVTNFGDWAAVIAGIPEPWLWRTLLIAVGLASYFSAVLVVGVGLVRYVGVPRNESRRMGQLTFVPYFTSIVLAVAAGLPNPVGIQLVWQSALPATAGAKSGLLWMRYYIPKSTVPKRESAGILRSYAWIVLAAALSLVFVLVLGRGILLHRQIAHPLQAYPIVPHGRVLNSTLRRQVEVIFRERCVSLVENGRG